MKPIKKIPLLPLFLLISFASVNAVLFTPGLPQIADFFDIHDDKAQLTLSWFLIAYTVGQLIYGPLTNRYGKKTTLYIGICLQMFSSILCILSSPLHDFYLLVIGRFLLGLGSGVGLKITFTLVNEAFEPQEAAQKTAYLMMAFAVTPGLAVAIGGLMATHFGWESCFYLGLIYGLLLLFLVYHLPKMPHEPNKNALKIKNIMHGYGQQFKNKHLVAGGLLMGSATCFVYVYAAVAPFVAMKLFHMSPAHYGIASFLPSLGLLIGSLSSAALSTRYALKHVLQLGIGLSFITGCIMLLDTLYSQSAWLVLFIPTMLSYFGLSLILANSSALAMQAVHNKADGSAVMNFLNMGTATLVVLSLGYFSITPLLLPIILLTLAFFMSFVFKILRRPALIN